MKTLLRKRFTLAFVLFAGALSACSKGQKSVLEQLGGEEPGIFSNRQITQKEFIAVVKLNSAPLLSTAKKVNGQNQIDPVLAQKIEAEQQATIADLKKLSSDIRILFRYRMVLNGMAIIAPLSLQKEIKSRLHVAYVEREGIFGRPSIQEVASGRALANAITERNSVKFIGADKVHQLSVVGADGSSHFVDGKGMKVGIIDTGIDYTHSMFGGVGTEEAYKAVNPDVANAAYPNAKVPGGIDLVGTAYDSGSGNYDKHLPLPDVNPIDEAGHGTHVAGTVAGIGDDTETYSGVAPEATVYAIKVFGADGSTGDAVVIAGLEYAADPNRDGKLDDQLDVVNMSLGSSYGNPHILYTEASGHLSRGGTVVVASAGNSGNHDYIVGAPSVADDAISVAASIDDGFHNWQFGAVRFDTASGPQLSEAVEGPISKPIADAGDVSGKLVFIGLANADLTPEVAAALKGHVALIDRGQVTFAEKVRRASEAGAIGVVVANNQPGNPFAMGGDGHYEIPAVMISQALGSKLKEEMAAADVVIHFQTPEKIEKPELIDTLTDFSSKGPRSSDGVLKPEISSPGANVISAAMGKGNKGVKMSGTSMAGPHVAGVMALLKQAHPDLTSAELKSILMGRAKSIGDENKQNYLLSRQGAGRVQTYESATAELVASQTAISLGEVDLSTTKTQVEGVHVRNISKRTLTIKPTLDSKAGLRLVNTVAPLTLAPGASGSFLVALTVDASAVKEKTEELDGLLKLNVDGKEAHRIPVLAVVRKVSSIAGSATATQGQVALNLTNSGKHDGVALPFNLLSLDNKKVNEHNDPFLSEDCDLQAAGYRIVEKTVKDEQGQDVKIKVLQIGVKVFAPMTTWNACEVSVLIDGDGDNVADQELAGIPLGNVKGLSTATNENQFASVLLDAPKTRALRNQFEQDAIAGKKVEENYADAALDAQDMTVFNRSTVVVVEADISKLAVRKDGQLSVKIATIFNEASSVEMDDFLAKGADEYSLLPLAEEAQAFVGLPQSVELKAGETSTASFSKGQGSNKLLLLLPDNEAVRSNGGLDQQLQLLSVH